MKGKPQEDALSAHRRDSAYNDAFQAFLSCTDEKEVLAREIGIRIRERGARSILDIGAGNGDLAIPLSKLVQRYTAVELNPQHAKHLREMGLEVVEQEFPCKIEGRYDIVLASHAIPRNPERYQPFLGAALEYTAPRGIFIGITYDSESSEWSELLLACGFRPGEAENSVNSNRRESMLQWIAQLGTVHVEEVTTFTVSRQLEEVILALAFVYSDGIPAKSKKFQTNKNVPRFLEENYKAQEIYKFPWHHSIIQVSRS